MKKRKKEKLDELALTLGHWLADEPLLFLKGDRDRVLEAEMRKPGSFAKYVKKQMHGGWIPMRLVMLLAERGLEHTNMRQGARYACERISEKDEEGMITM